MNAERSALRSMARRRARLSWASRRQTASRRPALAWRAAGLPLLAVSVACGAGDEPTPGGATSPALLVPEVRDAGSVGPFDLDRAAAPEAPLLDRWCARTGPDAADPRQALGVVADAYLVALPEACPRLLEGASAEQQAAFRTYIYEYTGVMAGCVNARQPPPGGILAFGPANTPAIGGERGPLSEADAGVLGAAYLEAFASTFGLDAADRELVAAHLARAARAVIDPGLPSLALCATVVDAG